MTGVLMTGLASHLIEGGVAYCIDTNNSFDQRPVVERLALHVADARVPLGRLFLSRAFTCHQLVTAVETMLPGADGRPAGGFALPASRSLAREAPLRPIVLLIGIDMLFVDEDLPLWERGYLFARLLDTLEAGRDRGLRLIATYGGRGGGFTLRQGTPTDRWGTQLRDRADTWLRASWIDQDRLLIEETPTTRSASPPAPRRWR
jgi:hypothetical protein